MNQEDCLLKSIQNAGCAIDAIGQALRAIQTARETLSGDGFVDHLGGYTIEGLGFAIGIIANQIYKDCDQIRSMLDQDASDG